MRRTVVRPNALRLFLLLPALVLSGGAAWAAKSPSPPASDAGYCQHVENPAARASCFESLKQLASGNVLLSLTLMRKAAAASPKSGIIEMLSGKILLRGGDQVTAERTLRIARKNGAPDESTLPPLFRAMIGRHEEQQLLTEFPEPANAKAGTADEIYHGRGLALMSLGRLDDAAASLDHALAIRRAPVRLRDRAEVAIRQGNDELGSKLLDEALKMDPANGPALMLRLDQLVQAGDPAKTLAFTDQIMKTYPNNIDSRVARIESFLKLKQDAKAKMEVDAILARSPSEVLGRYYSALLLYRANDKRGGWQIVMALPPEFVKNYPQYALQLEQIASNNGHNDSGAAMLGAALAAKPDMLDVRLRLASLRLSQNSAQSAQLVMSPVKDSKDPRVVKLQAQIESKIAKDRAF